MDSVFLSRLQFGMTIAFHIVWALTSVGISLFLAVLEGLWLKTGNDDYYRQARFWSRLFLLNVAIGVVSGVPMEFQFGTNWARFATMTGGFFGNILGFEATMAFMLEAGFLGIMMFGWKRVPRRMHFFATCMVALGASLSAFWIMVSNAWMQTPAGGYLAGDRFLVTSYAQAILNPDTPWSFPHMWVAALETVTFVVGGLSAAYILKNRHTDFFRKSFMLAFLAAIVLTPVQIYLGDGSGRNVAKHQPTKLGAMEAHWRTNPPGTGAGWKVLAWPNKEKQDNDWTFLTIPHGLSLLVTHSLTGQVKGLREFPKEDQPPLLIPFYAFRLMVLIGVLLLLLMLWTLWAWARGRLAPDRLAGQRRILSAWVAAIPLGYVAVEAGFFTREVGRQPWIIYGLLRTSDGASQLPAAAVATSLLIYGAIYTVLFFVFAVFAWRLLKQGPDLESPAPPVIPTLASPPPQTRMPGQDGKEA
jgi:cytochrome d ubiquinol oxidase subunit I